MIVCVCVYFLWSNNITYPRVPAAVWGFPLEIYWDRLAWKILLRRRLSTGTCEGKMAVSLSRGRIYNNTTPTQGSEIGMSQQGSPTMRWGGSPLSPHMRWYWTQFGPGRWWEFGRQFRTAEAILEEGWHLSSVSKTTFPEVGKSVLQFWKVQHSVWTVVTWYGICKEK